MAYSRRSLKRKTTKKRTAAKRKAPKARKTSRGKKSPKVASHRQTGYSRALMDPIKGPLVGIPSFVPIDTHRIRVRAIGDHVSLTGKTRVYFNPRRMVSNAGGTETAPIIIRDTDPASNAAPGDAAPNANGVKGIASNSPHSAADFQITSYPDYNADSVTNADGIRARTVAALFRVCNTSSANTRAGVFTALHEKHHKTLEDFTSSLMASQNDAIIKPAADGSYVNLLYRPVKPEEIEDWQRSAFGYDGEYHVLSAEVGVDGTLVDQYPGFMCIEFNGPPNQSLHIEAYAICEYVGESLTTLSRPAHLGGGKEASVKDIREVVKDAARVEAGQ